MFIIFNLFNGTFYSLKDYIASNGNENSLHTAEKDIWYTVIDVYF